MQKGLDVYALNGLGSCLAAGVRADIELVMTLIVLKPLEAGGKPE
jgi:hypothetical protein